ncbi:MAG: HNH endonuclease family protein [Candidatus Nanopelagicales bacterium]
MNSGQPPVGAPRRRPWRYLPIAIAAVLLGLSACASNTSEVPQSATPTFPSSPSDRQTAQGVDQTPTTRTTDTGTNPLTNPDGIKAGLGPVPRVQRPAALTKINEVQTKGRGPRTGYLRAEFGSSWTDNSRVPFSGDGCYTRDNILMRDLVNYAKRDRCVVVSGTLPDPFTGQLLPFSKADAAAIQIDHVVPLSLAWQMGAAGWSREKRTDFANDPLNLLAVEGRANGQKSDSGPASWLPANKSIRCAYVTRIAQVSIKYQLALPAPDKVMMREQCSG